MSGARERADGIMAAVLGKFWSEPARSLSTRLALRDAIAAALLAEREAGIERAATYVEGAPTTIQRRAELVAALRALIKQKEERE